MIEKRIHEGHSPICLAQEDACDEAEIEALRSALSKAESESTRLKAEVDEWKGNYEVAKASLGRVANERTDFCAELTRLKAALGKRMESEGLLRLAFNEKNHEVNVLREREKALVEAVKNVAPTIGALARSQEVAPSIRDALLSFERVYLAALSAEPEGKEKK